jgi:uncharacterized membrane protein (DUF4010 family)
VRSIAPEVWSRKQARSVVVVLNLNDALGILISALGGAAVGLEREWSGHAKGPKARFAGIRTFTLLGLEAGLAGWFWSNEQRTLAVVLLAAASALVVAAYVAASRRDVDGTTEVAALVVLAAGVAAGMRELQLASAVIATTTLLLVEKSRLHRIVERIDDEGLRAGFRFAVMAVVIFPMLPVGPYGPLGGVRPRQLWAMVLFFSGLSFAGYVTRRFVGAERGYPVTGILGGIISSTNVTLSFARMSRAEDAAKIPLAYGAIGASAVMFVRVGIATAVLNPATAQAVGPYLAIPFLVAASIAGWGIWRHRGPRSGEERVANPLQLWTAVQMALLFQLVLFGVRWAQSAWGQGGIFVSAGVLGFADVDALVISMTKNAGVPVANGIAAQAIAFGVLTNMLLKFFIGILFGGLQFRWIVGIGLAAVALASAISLAWLR